MNVWDYSPRPGTRTRRREIRQDVRNTLGTSGDEAPTARRSLRAGQQLAELIFLATDGQLKLALIDERSGHQIQFGDAISAADPSN